MGKLILRGVLLVAAAMAAYGQCPSPSQVGFRTVTVNGREVAVWYPTGAPEAPYTYETKLTGSVALNAEALTCAKFPVVMFSHGFSGCSTQSVHITETIARRGYIVAAPNHKDNRCGTDGGAGIQLPFTAPEAWTDGTYADRRDDMKAVLDWLLSSTEFRASADADRIGGMGHSLGGYTIIGLTGGWASWKDPRYKAALLLSPYLEPYLIQNRLANMKVPAEYQGGTLDITITPYIDGTKGNAYGMTGNPKLYLSLPRATHFEWTNATCARVSSSIASCLSADENARSQVDYSSDFLDRFLRGLDRPALWTRKSGLADFRRLTLTSPVSAASYLDATVASDSIVAAFGDAFTPGPGGTGATSLPLPATLAGTTVTLEDSTRRTFQAQLFYVSPRQVNFLLPADIASGPATVTVRSGGEIVSTGSLTAMPVVPAIFTAAGNGMGVPAAQALLVRPDQSRSLDLVFTPSTLAPVALDPRAGQLYIILYGTGFRRGATATATIGGVTVPILGISANAGFLGLDQIAVGPVPAGVPSGESDVIVTVQGIAANTVKLTFQ